MTLPRKHSGETRRASQSLPCGRISDSKRSKDYSLPPCGRGIWHVAVGSLRTPLPALRGEVAKAALGRRCEERRREASAMAKRGRVRGSSVPLNAPHPNPPPPPRAQHPPSPP